MEIYNVKDFIKGWLIGNFSPTLYDTNYFELSVKDYLAGEEELSHFHKVAIEYTIVLSGTIEMNDKIFKENDVILVKQNEVVKFKSITDSKTVVVKLPSVKNDKYIV